MLRLMRVMVCVLCVATVLAQLFGLGLLWYRGQLTSETAQELVALLRGPSPGEPEPEPAAETEQVSLQQVIDERAMRTLDLAARETEVQLLKALLDERRTALLAEKNELDRQRTEFSEKLASLRADTSSEATEQARSVLLSLQPTDAVANLMQLDLEEDVVLLSGMPPKSIGRILTAFQGGGDEERKRGAEIFQELSRGDPTLTALEDAAAQLGVGAPDDTTP